tara:strand:+ start:424 stop:627 length:204 start_codon:yes stop_codon:yes gene_type:complete
MMSSASGNNILIKKLQSDITEIKNDLEFIKAQLSDISQHFINNKKVTEKKDTEEWIKDEESIGWRIW